jgi:DNA-binding NarL/FixJ family response regulator
MKKKEIVIVDDHMLFANGLSKLVNSLPEYHTDKIFKNGQELVDFLSQKEIQMPDIILLDVKMPVMDGVETMKWIYQNKPDLKVLVLSMENNEDIIIQMIKYGAGGYLLKDIDPVGLKKALDIIDEQGYYYTEMVTNMLIHRLDNNDNNVKHDFKDNELKLIQLACSEKTYNEIAEEMCLSPKTIEGYRQVIFQKMGVKSRVGMVLYAIKNGIVEV